MSIKLTTKISKTDLADMFNHYFAPNKIDTGDYLIIEGKDGSTEFRHLVNITPYENADELTLTVKLIHHKVGKAA